MLKLSRFLSPYQWLIGGVLVVLLLQSIAELYLPTLMADIIDTGVVKGNVPYIWRVGEVMLLVALGSAACAVIASYLSARVGVGYGRDLRRMVFTRVESYSLHEFDKLGTATLITRSTNDVTQVQNVTIMILRMVVSAPIMAVGGLIMAVNKDAQLTLVLVIAIPVLVGLILIIFTRGMPLFKALQKKLDRVNLVLREGLTGIRVVRAFDRVSYEQGRFEDANRDLTNTSIRVNQIMAFLMPAMMLTMNITTLVIVWFGGLRIDAGHMQVGGLFAFMQYAMQILFSMVMMSIMFIMLPRAEVSAVRINEVLETVPEINDPVTPATAPVTRGYLRFDDVTFSYHGAEQPALSHISFEARPGQVTAIIGGTGSGKSTLVNLIPRFYDVQSGRVLIDGVDIRSITQEDLRSRIGFVPQKAVLFTGSIADNISYGADGATDDKIRRAATVAQAMEFIKDLPEGFEANVAQGGANLSGGQKQRLSIARALARRPEVYVFDDSFSALDFKTDSLLRAALKPETSDATVLIVAQRVSTVMTADQIVVLDDGRVAGLGDHHTLMGSCPVYREIVESQLSQEEYA